MSKQPRHWIEYTSDWRNEPMAYWAHKEQGNCPWREATSYVPPAPLPEGKKGFRVLCVEFGDVVLRFSSAAQLEELVHILSKKPLPTTRRLSALRGHGAGPNSHWLSSLPGHIKSPKTRSQVVRQLSAFRAYIGA